MIQNNLMMEHASNKIKIKEAFEAKNTGKKSTKRNEVGKTIASTL
jgi:hypothetical protein